jgi:hypothetical protein
MQTISKGLMIRSIGLIASLGVLVSASAQGYRNGNQMDSIPAGTQIRVRTNQTIDARDRSDGRVYTGVVDQDVTGQNGAVLIPRGSNAELIVNNVGNNDLSVDLESVTVNGRRYMVSAEAYNRSRNTGLGKNKRTGEFVGGGAALGAIIGAIAGGGKGAAIGAAAGGGAGAGTQVLTRGKNVRVPAESVLTFRLEQPFQLGSGNYGRDNGYNRNGNHYHDDYYRRQQSQQ